MNVETNPEISNKIELFKKYFLNREDVVSVKYKDKIFPVCSLYSLDYLLESHLKKEIKVGTYAPGLDGTTKYICVDFDGGNHASNLLSPKTAVLRTAGLFENQGLKTHIECSSSGAGYHLWVFFEDFVNALEARTVALRLIPNDLPLTNGEIADVEKGKGVELFPKVNSISQSGVGYAVFLPFGQAKENGGIFYRVTPDNDLEHYNPNFFETNSLAKLNELLVKFGGIHNSILLSSSKTEFSSANSGDWGKWRQDVLQLLDLYTIYGDNLTGRQSSEDWLEYRDPWSETGDSTPSAGISSGSTSIEKGIFSTFISAEYLSVFDYLRKAKIVEDDHLEACKYISNIVGITIPGNIFLSPTNMLPVSNSSNSSNPSLPTGNSATISRPIININNRQLRDIIADAWQALVQYNSDKLEIFVKAGMLVQLNLQDKIPTIDVMNQNEVYSHILRAANWVSVNNNGIANITPTEKIAADMLSAGEACNSGLPLLEFITTSPVFAKTGELVSKEGYSKAAKAWLKKGEDLKDLNTIPIQPSTKEVGTSRQFIEDELLYDFPFLTYPDKAHWFGALFLPFVRQMIDGPTPLHVVEAPTPGSGKGKLCNLISIIFTGRSCEALTMPSEDDSIRKMLTAELVKARPIVLFDNIPEKKRLDSASLAALLTSTDWTDRILGATRMTTLTNSALWLLTANNPQFSMELARRCIRIRIDPKIDQPWKRKGFKHEYVENWAMDNRSKLVYCVLVLIQSWIAAGKPLATKRLGTYERWSAVIGGILEHVGFKGFLENLEEMYENSDVEGNEWRQFIIKWFEAFGEQGTKLTDLVGLADKWDIMTNIIGDGGLKIRQNRLLNALRVVRDRVIGNHKIVEVKDKDKGSFKLIQVIRTENINSLSSAVITVNNDGE